MLLSRREQAGAKGFSIVVEGLRVEYGSPAGNVVALDGIDLAVRAGEFLCVRGPSGSGKSTLLHSLSGLREPDSGRIRLGDTDIRELADAELSLLRRRHVGLIYQFFHLVRSLTVRQNVALTLLMDGESMRSVREMVDDLLAAVSMTERAEHSLAELSGGELQRVAIARALLNEPDLLLADEPTGNLDHRTGDAILALIQRLCQQLGTTVVLVTHDPSAAAYADRMLEICDGRFVDSHGSGVLA